MSNLDRTFPAFSVEFDEEWARLQEELGPDLGGHDEFINIIVRDGHSGAHLSLTIDEAHQVVERINAEIAKYEAYRDAKAAADAAAQNVID